MNRRWMGRWFMMVAVLHTALAVVMFKEQWIEIAKSGVVDAVTASAMRGKAAWFGLFGVLLFLSGATIDALESVGRAQPLLVSAGTLLLAVIGIALMPKSGFWLVLPPVAAALIGRLRQPSEAEATSGAASS